MRHEGVGNDRARKSSSTGKKNTMDAAKRREASRRYYQSHPEVREKNRLRIAEKRLVAAKKAYRRQWDPPKKKPAVPATPSSPSDRSASDGRNHRYSCPEIEPTDILTPDEDAAHAALTTMYHISRRCNNFVRPPKLGPEREPRSLTDIAAYESSTEHSLSESMVNVEDSMADVAERHRARLAARRAARARSAEREAKAATTLEEQRLAAEKTARMRVVVESRVLVVQARLLLQFTRSEGQ
ncbi:hypothetical protein B0H13DRAFT_1927547 [Mycena leptocephala]|nr:hypothetical protein B0H13DRAFT_1927547 [Mycena leptocephala]